MVRGNGLGRSAALFSLLSLLLPILSFASPEADTIAKLAQSKAWHKLGHYSPRFLRSPKSEADGPAFFLAKSGASDPLAELTATIEAMRAPNAATLGDKDPRCRFPARYRWLRNELGSFDAKAAPAKCPDYEKYVALLSAKSAALVFSSYYLNNPASAFGHTFLRIGKHDTAFEGEKFELLDFGVNYAANNTSSNPFVYGFYGIFGGFEGVFTRIPYFYKVREYNDFESRDLWQYELALSPEELQRLVDHLWELGQTYFDYFYLDENCSYHMLSLLEAAAPRLELLDKLPLVVVPSDTVRVLADTPGIFGAIRYRPSLRRVFDTRVTELNRSEVKELEDLLAKKTATTPQVDALPKERKVAVLDAAADFVEFRHFRDMVNEPQGPTAEWKQRLLVERSKILVRSPTSIPKARDDERPERGHKSSRFAIEGGAREHAGGFGALTYRLALHDLLDPSPGYPVDAQIEFLRTRVTYFPKAKHTELTELTVFRVVSLSPWNAFAKPLSWHVKAGMDRLEDGDCLGCTTGRFEVGGGGTVRLGQHAEFAAFLDSGGVFTSRLRSFGRIGVGPSGLFRIRFTPRFSLLGEAGAQYLIFSKEKWGWRYSAGARIELFNNVALDARAIRTPWRTEAAGALMLYF